jgi:hypothetical protein
MTLSRSAPALLALAALLAASSPAGAQAPPPELKRLTVLLVADTNALELRDGVTASAAAVRQRLEAGVPKDRLAVKELKGADVSAKGLLDAVAALKLTPDDAVAVFYFGHGEYDADADQHKLVLGARPDKLARDDLVAALHASTASLKVLITDCCSNTVKKPLPQEERQFKTEPPTKLDPMYGCLFFQHRGLVDVTAADRGTFAFYDDSGGVFTTALVRLWDRKWRELDTNKDQFLSWKELYPQLREETNKVFTEKKAVWGEEGLRGQKTQYAFAFAIPEPDGGAGPGAFAATRLGLVLRPTPLGLELDAVGAGQGAKAGLTTGRVLVRVDGQRVRTQDDLNAALSRATGKVKLELAPPPIRREVALQPDGNGGWKLGARVQKRDDGEGVRVVGLTPNGPAQKLGIEPGDVIVGVNGEAVKSNEQYGSLLDASRGRARLEIIDVRNSKPEMREVTLAPEK